MSKYGFSIVHEGAEEIFLFQTRDWNILCDQDSFLNVSKLFQSMLRLSVLEANLTNEGKETLITRTKNRFLSELRFAISAYKLEQQQIIYDYSVEKEGSLDGAQKSLSCNYLGHFTMVRGKQGGCFLEMNVAEDGVAPRTIGRIDLCHFPVFEADDNFVIKVRKRKKGSSILSKLQELESYVESHVSTKEIVIKLVS